MAPVMATAREALASAPSTTPSSMEEEPDSDKWERTDEDGETTIVGEGGGDV